MSNKYISEINIIYDIYENSFYFGQKKEIINIFGEKFIKNNRNNCKMIIDNKEYNIEEKFKITNNNNILNIKLKGIENIIDMSNMFYGCKSLLSLPDISKWNTINVTNMSYMFYGCKSLLSLPDISKWNTINVIDMSYMFYGCISLSTLPDISKWNIINATNMSYMLYGCISLSSLPDISKWNTKNVTNISYMFNGCVSLTSLPDITKWNIINFKDIRGIYRTCISLLSFPNIFIKFEKQLDKEAIEVVMQEGHCSKQVAIAALLAYNGDPVEAFLDV